MTVGRKIQTDDKLRAWVRAGRPFKPWDKQPRLTEADAWLREAWRELDTCRPQSMAGVGRIPWTAIETYAVANDVPNRARFHALIRQMDDAYLEAMHERHDKEHGDRENGKAGKAGEPNSPKKGR